MKFSAVLFSCALLLAACNNQPVKTSSSAGSGDAAFDSLAAGFLKGYLAWRPQLAAYLGMHEYDGRISDYSKPSLDSELQRLKTYDQQLNSIDTASLSAKHFYDFRILRMGIKSEIFNFADLRSYSRNPMAYAGLVDVNLYLKRNYAPLEKRLGYIIDVEKKSLRFLLMPKPTCLTACLNLLLKPPLPYAPAIPAL